METEINRCAKCKNFSMYYVKGIKHFFNAETGYCNEKQCDVKAKDKCEKFALKSVGRKPSEDLLAKIGKLFAQMNEVRILIEEELGKDT